MHQFHKSDFLPRIAFKIVLNETIDAVRIVALDQDSLFIAVVSDKTTSLGNLNFIKVIMHSPCALYLNKALFYKDIR